MNPLLERQSSQNSLLSSEGSGTWHQVISPEVPILIRKHFGKESPIKTSMEQALAQKDQENQNLRRQWTKTASILSEAMFTLLWENFRSLL